MTDGSRAAIFDFRYTQKLYSKGVGMIRGYARVSTKGQQLQGTSLEDQFSILEKEGCEAIYHDVGSGAKKRAEFDRLCLEAQPGDTIVVTKLDRIARSVVEGSRIIKGWFAKGITVRILNMPFLQGSGTDRLLVDIMLAFAEFERSMIMERTRQGKEYKRATDPGFKDGRPKKFRKEQLDLAMTLLKDKSYKETTRATGISKATLQREAARRGFRKSEVVA